MATTTSVYAAAWRAIYRILSEATLPSDMVTMNGLGYDGQPHKGLFFAGFPQGDEPNEYVMVRSVSEPNNSELLLTFNHPVVQETMLFVVHIQTERDGQTQWQALDRLEELTAIVETAIDEAGINEINPPEEFIPFQGRLERVGFDGRHIYPGKSGYIGTADVRVNVLATRR